MGEGREGEREAGAYGTGEHAGEDKAAAGMRVQTEQAGCCGCRSALGEDKDGCGIDKSGRGEYRRDKRDTG